MEKSNYYNRKFKIIDIIIIIIGFIILGIGVYGNRNTNLEILMVLGVRNLLLAYNSYKLNNKSESMLSLVLGIFALILIIVVKTG